MNILGIYLVIQLWANSIGLITINKYNSIVNKKIKESGYYYSKKDSMYPANDYILKIIYFFIPFYYCFKGIMLLDKTNKQNIDKVIKSKVETGEIKDVINLDNMFFNDHDIEYKRKHYSTAFAPKEPYKASSFNERHTTEGEIIFDTFDESQHSGITPFVDTNVKSNSRDVIDLMEFLNNKNKIEQDIFNTPLDKLKDFHAAMGKVIDYRIRTEDPILVRKNKDESKVA